MPNDDLALLDQVVGRVESIIETPSSQVVGSLRPVVTDLMLATNPDGSWPGTVLIREALSMAVDIVESVIAEQGIDALNLTSDDRRWLDACRAMCGSIVLLDDMLDDLRRETRPPGPSVSGAESPRP